eukprot:8450315-Alexandrium_andersonii.AAC.1
MPFRRGRFQARIRGLRQCAGHGAVRGGRFRHVGAAAREPEGLAKRGVAQGRALPRGRWWGNSQPRRSALGVPHQGAAPVQDHLPGG